jgi:cytochrome P450
MTAVEHATRTPAPAVPPAPAEPGAVPLLGHALRLMKDPLGFFLRIRERAPIVRIRIGVRTAYVVNRADLARQVLVKDHRSYDKGGPVIEAVRMVTGNGLGACDAQDHDRQRPMMQPSFHHSRFPAYVAVMKDCTAAFADSWADGQEISVGDETYQIFSEITTRTLVSTSEGVEAAVVMGRTMPSILRGAFRRAIIPWRVVHRIPTPANLAYNRSQKELGASIDRIVRQYRDEDTDRGDVLSLIMAARNEDTGLALSDAEVRDQIRTVLAGSIETEASMLSWVFQLLAENPGVEQKLWSELSEVLGEKTAPDYDDLARLAYTKQVVTEAHRLYPPIWMITRIAMCDTVLGGRAIPRGSDILFSPYVLHRDPEVFPEPDRFLPERWAAGTVTPAQREGFLGFGAGHTKCLGDVFGPTAVTMALAAISRRWRLRPVAEPLVPLARVTLSPTNLTMRVERRETAEV